MVANGLRLLESVFSAVVSWFSDIMAAVGGRPYVIAGFLIFLVCGLLIIPIRGSAISSIKDMSVNSIHRSSSSKSSGGNKK